MTTKKLTPIDLAKKLHEIYERRANEFNFNIIPKAFDPDSLYCKHMIAVCTELMAEGSGIGIIDLHEGEKVMSPNVVVELVIKFTRGSTIDMDITKNRILPDERLDDVCLSMATHARDYFKLKMGDKTPKIQLLNDPRKLN